MAISADEAEQNSAYRRGAKIKTSGVIHWFLFLVIMYNISYRFIRFIF